jgi:plasmid stability protein
MPEKTESVQFYVNEDTKQALRIAAAENQGSMAEFARDALQEALEDHGVRFDEHRLANAEPATQPDDDRDEEGDS